MRKIISMLLCVMLVCAILPISASAVQATEQTGGTAGDWQYTLSNGEAKFAYCTSALSGSVEIPSQLDGYPVTVIGDPTLGAFPNSMTTITSVVIPSTVTVVYANSFKNFPNLVSVAIPNTVVEIGASAFLNCVLLESISLPSSLTILGSGVFNTCSSLPSVVVPNGITEIGSFTFYNCINLTSITLPNSLSVLGFSAFNGCPGSISNQIILPNTLTIISPNALLGTQGVCYYAENTVAVAAAGNYSATTPWTLLESAPIVETQDQTEVGASDVPIVATAEGAVFKAVVPISLPANVDNAGQVLTASNATVLNSCSFGKIQVKSVTVVAVGVWQLKDTSANLSIEKVDSKFFSMSVNGRPADSATGVVDCSGMAIPDISETVPITYSLSISPQSAGLSAESVGTIVVVVGWYE